LYTVDINFMGTYFTRLLWYPLVSVPGKQCIIYDGCMVMPPSSFNTVMYRTLAVEFNLWLLILPGYCGIRWSQYPGNSVSFTMSGDASKLTTTSALEEEVSTRNSFCPATINTKNNQRSVCSTFITSNALC
jgi:hypothetical protein